jgi:hypothetical protein
MAGIDGTDEHWPILVFRFNETVSLVDYERLFALYERSYTRRERFASIMEGKRVVQVPPPAARRFVAEQAKVHEPQSIRWVAQSTVVLQNSILRGAVTAITWLSPPVYPLSFAPTFQTAVETVTSALRHEGREIPKATLERLLASAES